MHVRAILCLWSGLKDKYETVQIVDEKDDSFVQMAAPMKLSVTELAGIPRSYGQDDYLIIGNEMKMDLWTLYLLGHTNNLKVDEFSNWL